MFRLDAPCQAGLFFSLQPSWAGTVGAGCRWGSLGEEHLWRGQEHPTEMTQSSPPPAPPCSHLAPPLFCSNLTSEVKVSQEQAGGPGKGRGWRSGTSIIVRAPEGPASSATSRVNWWGGGWCPGVLDTVVPKPGSNPLWFKNTNSWAPFPEILREPRAWESVFYQVPWRADSA